MKRNVSYMTITIIMLILSFFNNADAINLAFNPSETLIDSGQTFQVDIMVSGMESANIAAFDLNVNYDNTSLVFYDYVLSDELGKISNFEAEDWGTGDNGQGVINISEFSWLWDFSFQPDLFTLATMTFFADSGDSKLHFSEVFLADEWGEVIYANYGEGTVDISESSPVPEPCTLLLTGIGLIALGSATRKVKTLREL